MYKDFFCINASSKLTESPWFYQWDEDDVWLPSAGKPWKRKTQIKVDYTLVKEKKEIFTFIILGGKKP